MANVQIFENSSTRVRAHQKSPRSIVSHYKMASALGQYAGAQQSGFAMNAQLWPHQ